MHMQIYIHIYISIPTAICRMKARRQALSPAKQLKKNCNNDFLMDHLLSSQINSQMDDRIDWQIESIRIVRNHRDIQNHIKLICNVVQKIEGGQIGKIKEPIKFRSARTNCTSFMLDSRSVVTWAPQDIDTQSHTHTHIHAHSTHKQSQFSIKLLSSFVRVYFYIVFFYS